MFQADTSFNRFLTALQQQLQLAFERGGVAEKVCLLRGANNGPRIAYYRCGAGARLPLADPFIHIDEDVWVRQPDLLLNRIAARAGLARRVHARHTVVARIEKYVAMAFLRAHHVQGALPGKYRYGLYHHGDLVGVSVFSGGRRMAGRPADYRSFELLRFCHKQGVHVVGGFSKLLKAFQRDFNPGDIMTYADKDWSDGSSYHKTGFIRVGEIPPQVSWVDCGTMHRYDERTLPTEIGAMPAHQREKVGYTAVYNSGSIKLVKTLIEGD